MNWGAFVTGFLLGTALLALFECAHADISRTKEFYVRSKASLELCEALRKFRHIKGTVYATMSQEVPACPRYVWVTSCAIR